MLELHYIFVLQKQTTLTPKQTKEIARFLVSFYALEAAIIRNEKAGNYAQAEELAAKFENVASTIAMLRVQYSK